MAGEYPFSSRDFRSDPPNQMGRAENWKFKFDSAVVAFESDQAFIAFLKKKGLWKHVTNENQRRKKK